VAVAEGIEDARWRRRTFGEREVFADPYVWLGQVDVELADGGRYWHDVLRLHRAVVIALVNGDDHVLMVGRHRFIQDRWGWELPGDLVDEDEEDAEAAARILEDETGFRARRFELLTSFQPIPGRIDARHAVFLAREGEQVGEPREAGGAAHIEWVPLYHARELVAAGEIWHGASLVGVLHLLAFGPIPR
jgi:8-oxo-dGDP phosphatase